MAHRAMPRKEGRKRVRITTMIRCAAILLLVACTACRKELYYHDDDHALTVKVYAVTSWKQEWERTHSYNWKESWLDEFRYTYDALRPDKATGIKATVYGDDGYSGKLHLPAEGGKLPLREGKHAVLLYNNDTEYIVFDGLSASTSATATTRTLTRASLGTLHKGERTINQPDQLYAHYLEECTGEKTLEKVELPVTMHPLTYTYLIRYKFSKGLKYVALTRGALAGMAEKVYLNDGRTGSETATILFDCSQTDFGADVCMKCFGVPNYPGDHNTRADGTPAYYTLNLEVRLNNGKVLNYEFDVTDQVNAQPRGGVITVDGIEVDDEDGMAGSGGFDVTVDGWGDYMDIPLPLG